MLSGDLLRWLAVLILSNRVFSVPHQDKWQDLTIHKRNHLLARQDPPPDTMAPTPYIILADRDATREQIQNLKNILSTEAVPGSLEEVPSKRTGLVVFFKAAITSAQADAIAKVPGFGSATPDSKLEEDQPPSPAAPPSSSTPSQPSATGPPGSPQTTLPNPADIGLQSDAADDLKIISQPRGSSLKDIPAFGYASEAGKGVTIYAIDTGANIQHPEWTGMTGDKSFIYAPGAVQEETDFASHGSCVASKSAGPAYGTAKDANMVMVKLPDDLSLSAVFAALVEVSNDVYEKGIEGKAVIVMALGHTIPDLQMSTETAYRLLIIAIMAEDIVIVTASGNEATDEFDDLSDYPALFGDTTDIIVVGGVTNDGSRAFFSQGTGDQLTTSAPAFISCASGGSSGSKRAYGTSFAAPTVAGVVAVWLSQAEHHARLQVPGEVAAKAKAMVKSFSYPRVTGGPPVIWNGIDPRRRACRGMGNTANRRRQDGDATDCEEETTPTSAAAAAAPTGSSSTTSRPPPPPPPFRPSWSENPQGFRRVFERDGVASDNYDATSNSASERVTGNIEQWCLAKCTDRCASVFLYRVLQFRRGAYFNPYYVCNRYNSAWSTDFVKPSSSSIDSGVAFK
ncbi:Subtilisin-like protease 3 [Colletotrichum higginsianum]|uniref:Subtilisin-like protease 3 n=1 Tax=Colletotrichum higginsianum TaxID=80884 RepID=A0A4T0VD74_9PEZI|nr:Subtilisin-like protease 3 [Colletotrichum higginsianum]